MKWNALLLLIGMASAAAGASAQEGPAPVKLAREPRALVTINPLGFLQFGPNVEVEIPAGVGVVVLGLRAASLGLMSHAVADAEGDILQSSWTVTAAWRVYPERAGLEGWFLGPRFEYGSSRTRDYEGRLVVGGAEGGYRWLRDNLGVSIGIQSGAVANRYRHRLEAGDAGTEVYGIAMLVFGIGIAVR